MNARERGGLFPDCDSYRRVFSTVAERLGDTYAQHLHCHFSASRTRTAGKSGTDLCGRAVQAPPLSR